jgi:hypothetical protein
MKQNEAVAKNASVTSPTGGSTRNADEDAPVVPPPPPKVGVLPTGLSRAIVIASLVLTIGVGIVELVSNRYTLAPSTRSDTAIVYRIDHMTGRVSVCSPAACRAVTEGMPSTDSGH